MEFMFMVMAASLAMIVFMVVFSEMYQDNLSDKKRILAKDYGYSLQNEFLVATGAKSGYIREFKIPQKLEGYDFNTYVKNNTLAINYSEGVYFFQLPAHTGTLIKGNNNIRNINGSICVNC